jgi:hypothetical protein
MENRAMLRVFDKMGFDAKKTAAGGVYELKMLFQGPRGDTPLA